MSTIGEVKFGLEISKGVVAKFAMAAIGFVGALIFARELGPGGYGAFYLVVTLVNILDNPVTGWADACKKRISETVFPSEEAFGSGLIGAGVNLLLVVPLVAGTLLIKDVFGIRSLFVPFSFLFGSIVLFAVTNRLLSAQGNFASAQWSDTLRSLFTFPLQLALVLAGFGAAGMVYGLATATLLTVPYVLYRLRMRPTLPSRESLRSIWQYARYSIPSNFVGTAQSRVDVIILGALLATTDFVGYYEVALRLTLPATFVAEVTSTGLMARVSNLHSRGKAVVPDARNALSYASLLAFPIFFGSLAIPEELVVAVFGEAYRPAGAFLVGLALYQVLSAQTGQFNSIVAGMDLPRRNLVVSAISLAINVLLGYVLLVTYGPLGVVGATLVAEAFKYLALGLTVKRSVPDIGLVPRPVREQLLAGGVMFLVVHRVHQFAGDLSWVQLVLLLGLGGGVYFLVLALISAEHRATARGILRDARA